MHIPEIGPEGCQFNYVVSAAKPTNVQHSLVGRFTSPSDLNLVISKCTRLEIHRLTPEGLQGMVDVPIYGRISVLRLFRPPGQAKDLLFLLTEKCQFCVLGYDEAKGELVTRAAGDASERVGRPVEAGQMGLVDPASRLIGLHLYDGHFKVIPIDERGELQEAFTMRLEELMVIDLAFLHAGGGGAPLLAVLYEDTKEQRHVKTYEVSLRDKELVEGSWVYNNLDEGASLLIPVPHTGGAVVVGKSAITYVSQAGVRSVGIRETFVKAWGAIDEDGTRLLLGDWLGNLHLLVLARDAAGRVDRLQLERLGRTPQASTISYLDSNVVFVGSSFGDSQLIRLHSQPPDPSQPSCFIEVLDTIPNLGPIVDFAVVDLERQGQGQVVTCSGVGMDGSLRVVRNGIGVVEQATVELPGIKGVWSLRSAFMDAHNAYLVLTFVGETRVLGLNADDELDEAELPGFDADAQTLWCGTLLHDQWLQVTSAGVRLVDCMTRQLAAEWRPPAGSSISVASTSPQQVVLAVGGGRLVYLEVGDGALRETAAAELGADVACLDLTPVGDDPERSALLAVGTWDMELLLLLLPDLTLLGKQSLGKEVIPRSVLFAQFDGCPYLLVGMGDGHLINYRLKGRDLVDRKRLALGTKPIALRTFVSRGAAAVFAASDRPTIVHSSSKKLLYSNLNENEVNFLASFHTPSFPDSLAIAKEGSLTIGTMDEIQKLHIRAIPLGEQPRRIAHQEASHTFAILTTQQTMGGDEVGPDSVRLLDEQTFETLDRFQLQRDETACSLTSASFEGDPAPYYVVGTAVQGDDEPEPSRGRILVFAVREGRLLRVAEKESRGAVYCARGFQGRLLAGINSRVQVYRWAEGDVGGRQLLPECSHVGHVLVLYLDTRGDFVLLGDLMKSVQVLVYKAAENSLEVLARDYSPSWMSSVCVLDDDTYLGAENSYNLFAVRKNSDAATDEERSRLEVVGRYHLGEFVNRLQHGSLVMKLPDSELSRIPTVLYGSINGVIGIVASLPLPTYQLLERLQEVMRKVVRGVGGLDHRAWRGFSNPHPALGGGELRQFIDGDLIEQFLDLRRESQEAVVEALASSGGAASGAAPPPLDDVTRLVEELSRVH